MSDDRVAPFPLLGFAEETISVNVGPFEWIYFCHPTPETSVIVIPRSVGAPLYVAFYGGQKVRHSATADCPLQVQGLIHHFVAEYSNPTK